MEYSLRSSFVIGLSATSASILALSSGIKDWKMVGICASLGCFIGSRYIESGQLLN